jgi:hypothetical protein
MADLTDAADAIVDLIVAALYPQGLNGLVKPEVPVKVYPGWPDPSALEGDLGLAPAGNGGTTLRALHVSVYNMPSERNVDRFPHEWRARPLAAPTYGLTVAGQVITVTGAAPSPHRRQNVAVKVFPKAYVYTTQDGDTPAEIASALRDLIAADVPGATVSGADITIPALYRIGFGRVGVMGSAIKEIGRQEKAFQITLWADTPDNRKWLAQAVAPALAQADFLTLADGTRARFIKKGETDIDRAQRQGAYRRDFVYTVEYATTIELEAAQVVVAQTELTNPQDEVIASTIS